MLMGAEFIYMKIGGSQLPPEKFGGREPRIGEVIDRVTAYKELMVAVELVDGVHWLRKGTYSVARNVLGTSGYEAREGVTFTSAKGAWLVVGEPTPVEAPVGAPRGERYVAVETELSRAVGLPPVIIEERFVFRGFKGEDVSVGRVTRYRYFIAAYKKNGTPLSPDELEQTMLWKNYLSKPEVTEVLGGVSKLLREELWHLERMGGRALSRYKVVWRDVARRFVPAVETSGAVPDYTVNYVPVNSFEEACYLMAVLLASQVNAVVEELTPWVGHVQPRFVKYFKIPKYNAKNEVHRRLAEIGKVIHNGGEDVLEKVLKEVDELVEKL
jgi:hypothetical protein